MRHSGLPAGRVAQGRDPEAELIAAGGLVPPAGNLRRRIAGDKTN